MEEQYAEWQKTHLLGDRLVYTWSQECVRVCVCLVAAELKLTYGHADGVILCASSVLVSLCCFFMSDLCWLLRADCQELLQTAAVHEPILSSMMFSHYETAQVLCCYILQQQRFTWLMLHICRWNSVKYMRLQYIQCNKAKVSLVICVYCKRTLPLWLWLDLCSSYNMTYDCKKHNE